MTKITIERETLQAATDMLEAYVGYSHEYPTALRAALAAQPAEAQQEPVAWLRFQEHADRPTTVHLCDSDHPRAFQVYAAQPAPAAVPLTDEQIALAIFEARVGHSPFKRDGSTSFRIARSAIAIFCEVNGIAAAGDKT